MKTHKLSELQKELRDRGISELAEKLKRETGYNPVARKLRRNPSEVKAAYRTRPDELRNHSSGLITTQYLVPSYHSTQTLGNLR